MYEQFFRLIYGRPRIRVRRYRRVIGRVIRRRRRKAPNVKDYLARKEAARSFALARLHHFQQEYSRLDPTHSTAMTYNKLAIRNQRSRWGSCSANKNLNFNYRILDLPPELADYVIVHELCHLKELHHGRAFWDLMKLMIPDAEALNRRARKMRIE